MKFLAALDERLIALVQEAYLWLWDRTGVFVGTLVATLMLIAAWLTTEILWGGALLAAVFTIYGVVLIFMQGAGLASFNVQARRWRGSILRILLIVYDVASLLGEVYSGHLAHALAGILIIVSVLYLPCVQLRDREPPEKHVFASEGA